MTEYSSSSPPSTTTTTTIDDTKNNESFKVVFIHLDLGIGGAEQLVLQLATASQDLNHSVSIITTRCDQDHCFEAVCYAQNGRLANSVQIYGNWIPQNVLGIATTLCSTIRVLWLTYQVTRLHQDADVVVVDVLPTSLPLLLAFLPNAGTLFYCHFPDKLLIRSEITSTFKRLYRRVMDTLEEITMKFADTLVVNSKFTYQQVEQTFQNLNHDEIQVLYPALDTSRMTQPSGKSKSTTSPIVSLNRYERKKNIGLLIESYAYLKSTYPSSMKLPPVIIAGGYDTKNVENVEYRGELQHLVNSLGLTKDEIQFRMDISDEERARLFQDALVVVYTPAKEHFGIVPLEAMYAETPVIAVNSGGPTETVKDGITGYLRNNTPEDFGFALQKLIDNPQLATTMGQAGRRHVESTLGTLRLKNQWKQLMEETQVKSQRRNSQSQPLVLWTNTILYLLEALMAVIVCVVLTWLLRSIGLLETNQSIVGAIRTSLYGTGDEL